MGFNTEKNKIRKTWDKSLHNNINNLKRLLEYLSESRLSSRGIQFIMNPEYFGV